MIRQALSSAGRVLLGATYPRRCAACGIGIGTAGCPFCPGCDETLRREGAQPACPTCGHRLGIYGLDEQYRCIACRDRELRCDGVARFAPYEGMVRELLLGFKFRGRDGLDAVIGGLVAEAVQAAGWFKHVDALVVVPTHWRHDWGRPIYAAGVIGAILRKRTGLRAVRVMRRVAAGPHQYELPREQRAENIRGKFAMIPGGRVRGARLCLVDDVSTTGATLNECAGVLKRAGARRVFAAVFAKVDTMAHLVGEGIEWV